MHNELELMINPRQDQLTTADLAHLVSSITEDLPRTTITFHNHYPSNDTVSRQINVMRRHGKDEQEAFDTWCIMRSYEGALKAALEAVAGKKVSTCTVKQAGYVITLLTVFDTSEA